MPDKKKTAKALLAAALKEKMCHKPLDKITVREITEECGVNRQTFYYHFEDIYDLLKWVYQQEIILLMKKQEVVKTWQDALLVLLDYLTLNHDFCLNTLNSVGYRNLRRFFYQDVNSIVTCCSRRAETAAPIPISATFSRIFTLCRSERLWKAGCSEKSTKRRSR